MRKSQTEERAVEIVIAMAQAKAVRELGSLACIEASQLKSEEDNAPELVTPTAEELESWAVIDEATAE